MQYFVGFATFTYQMTETRDTLSDERERWLIARAAKGDRAAFKALYRAYLPRLYGYIAGRVGNAHDAEDLCSETFIIVVEKLSMFDYRGVGSFAAWLFAIAYRVVGAHYRRGGRNVLPLYESDAQTPPPRLPDESVHHAVAKLSPRRQEIVTLRYFGGLRNTEIADLLGLDERTVASHLSRALKDLSEILDEEEVAL